MVSLYIYQKINTSKIYCQNCPIISGKPFFPKKIRNQSVDEGGDLRIKIPFSSTSLPNFKLLKDDREIRFSMRVHFESSASSAVLHIKSKCLFIYYVISILTILKLQYHIIGAYKNRQIVLYYKVINHNCLITISQFIIYCSLHH